MVELLDDYSSKLCLQVQHPLFQDPKASTAEKLRHFKGKSCNGKSCKGKSLACLILQVESLLGALESIGLWPGVDPKDINPSASHLRDSFQSIRVSGCDRHKSDPPSSCGVFRRIVQEITEMTSQKSVVTQAQAKHMELQRRKTSIPEINWE